MDLRKPALVEAGKSEGVRREDRYVMLGTNPISGVSQNEGTLERHWEWEILVVQPFWILGP